MYYLKRINIEGGDFSLYLCAKFECKAVGSMTTDVNSIMEVITVEILREK